jgi:hypothetical protein
LYFIYFVEDFSGIAGIFAADEFHVMPVVGFVKQQVLL